MSKHLRLSVAAFAALAFALVGCETETDGGAPADGGTEVPADTGTPEAPADPGAETEGDLGADTEADTGATG